MKALVTPRVSMVLACYNGAAWLDQAISSVLDQTFRDFELVVVDDGSTDSSPSIIAAAAKRDERFVALTKHNTGLADSLNVGIAAARGEWIARLDADDLSAPSRLQEQLDRATSSSNVVFVGTGFHQIAAEGRQLASYSYPQTHTGLLRRLERMQGFPPHSSAMFRKAAFDKVGGYRKQITRAEDWDLWLRLSEVGELASVPAPLVSIRRHEGQLSNDVETQLTQAYAATAAHFLRLHDEQDPLDRAPEFFLSWIHLALQNRHVFQRRRIWQKAKETYSSSSSPRSVRATRLAVDLLTGGHALDFAGTRLFGSSTGRALAKAWLQTDPTVRDAVLTNH